jgi:Diacylglycerol kinase catalytic domain
LQKSRHLDPGQDLAALAGGAAADGADVLGAAGGDGSLAVVAAVAAAHGIAFACIPAGTRNHFALDLGVDRHDLTGALDAFTDGVERRIDVAEVNGRLFLNNVSLGIYGQGRSAGRPTATPRCARSWRPRRRCWARAGRHPRCAWSTTRDASTAIPPWWPRCGSGSPRAIRARRHRRGCTSLAPAARMSYLIIFVIDYQY